MIYKQMGSLFTIGHSLHSIGDFVELLKVHNINFLIDVRSVPYSKYATQFDREALQDKLELSKICYSFMGQYFGARPSDQQMYDANGQVDFERVRASARFQRGIDNILLGLKKGYNITLMCVEKSPFDCHRAILVARAFEERDVDVTHILADGTVQSQQAFNQRLLTHYFPDMKQMSLFQESIYMHDAEYICEAYRKRNKEIGYVRNIIL